MKKLLSILLIFTILLTTVGCAGGSKDGTSPTEEYPATSEAHERPVPDAPDTEIDESDGKYESTTDEAATEDYPGDYETDYSASGESYLTIDENREKSVEEESTLTFSLKVDTAAYTNVMRYIESGNIPPADAVRTEELINYFNYDEKMEFGKDPFAIYTEIGPSPFDKNKVLAFTRVSTKEIDKSELPDSNLTFLIDTSGSMFSDDKLPLLKEAFTLLVETLDENDRVSIVTYAGNSAVALDSASGAQKSKIIEAINDLEAGGSTAGADGIVTAYKLAEKNFLKDGNNRVILASDGDFNVGISNLDDLSELISNKRDSGVYLSILGFGTGNIRDDIMETLAKDGNGNYSYINSISTANKVLVEELGSNLFTVADDVKAQVEFNPQNVKSYRLIGYENRTMSNEDFEDDTKDAGEIGIGTDVVVLFEIELNDSSSTSNSKYSADEKPAEQNDEFKDELFEVRIRYKDPGQSDSKLIERPVMTYDFTNNNSSDFNFASSVAAFAHILRDSQYSKNISFNDVYSLASKNLGKDNGGYRKEHIDLLTDYASLTD